ncbi:MAG TPA: Fe-S protein assembly co-chaperone HscB, partial [Methylotenera sp.]|nr:Fe-S protein assembly co-chaperone HscB [Methylotenera sp.]
MNYFEFFKLPQTFNLDVATLESNYRKIQSESHPDRFVIASSAEKLASMQTATLANEAYLTLKSAGLRAAYLLSLQGIVAIDEKNNQMPADFLMQQMEWREAIEDAENAHDVLALENLLAEIEIASKNLEESLKSQFQNNDLNEATESARKLIFMDKVRADILKSIEKL